MYSENKKPAVYVIIPAFNESKSIAKVLADIPDLVNETIVVNNASTDDTETIAKEQGATVLRDHRNG
ncbi:glycosyltransferase, partial [Daejeonella sp.]|uniref:glycosyltransferase n=1 Tax=Daejeonella sp. TaxID=2805397 RepID=UPI0037BF4DB1